MTSQQYTLLKVCDCVLSFSSYLTALCRTFRPRMGNRGYGRWNSGQRGGVWDWHAQYATPQGRSDEQRETCARIEKA